MLTTVVAMFCGPHEDGNVLFHRIDAATFYARTHQLPLLVAGDSNYGFDVEIYCQRARARGVRLVEPCYDDRHPVGSTLIDAKNLALALTVHKRFERVIHVHLFTDWWHVQRARTMAQGEIDQCMGDTGLIRVIAKPVDAPHPGEARVLGEKQGLQSYLNGTYDSTQAAYAPWGKPAHDALVRA